MAIAAFKDLRKLIADPKLAQFTISEASPGSNYTKDEDILSYVV